MGGAMSDKLLDTKGLRCPLPVLRARKAMKDMDPGQVIEIHATDPGSVQDFQAFCETTGHVLLDSLRDGEVYIFEIRKAG
jgi:tRNA 2-thiouridine synthesizing protein A